MACDSRPVPFGATLENLRPGPEAGRPKKSGASGAMPAVKTVAFERPEYLAELYVATRQIDQVFAAI